MSKFLGPVYYFNRGLTYGNLKNSHQAISDYNRCFELDSTDISAAWIATWINMDKQRPGVETAERLERIAAIEPKHYIASVCKGIALGLKGNLKEGLNELERAIALEPEEWDPYFWKGMLSAYYYKGPNQVNIVMAAIERALAAGLPPILLTPLYWLEKDRSNVFITYAKLKLDEYQIQ